MQKGSVRDDRWSNNLWSASNHVILFVLFYSLGYRSGAGKRQSHVAATAYTQEEAISFSYIFLAMTAPCRKITINYFCVVSQHIF
jgi:hypothetical protein